MRQGVDSSCNQGMNLTVRPVTRLAGLPVIRNSTGCKARARLGPQVIAGVMRARREQ
jgi:hypothetical protein